MGPQEDQAGISSPSAEARPPLLLRPQAGPGPRRRPPGPPPQVAHTSFFPSADSLGQGSVLVQPCPFLPPYRIYDHRNTMESGPTAKPLSHCVLFGPSLSIYDTGPRRFLGSWLPHRETQASCCSQDGCYCRSSVGEEGHRDSTPKSLVFPTSSGHRLPFLKRIFSSHGNNAISSLLFRVLIVFF